MPTNDMSDLVTRAILKEELSKYPTREELTLKLDTLRSEVRDDMNQVAKTILEQMEVLLGLREEPVKDLTDRIKTLEGLPERVSELEAKVFRPKAAPRRRSARNR